MYATVERYIRISKPQGWTRQDAFKAIMRGEAACFKYTEAELNETQFVARSFGRARTRPNYWAVVEYMENSGEVQPYVACLKNFLKVQNPRHPDAYLRLAVTDLYAKQPHHGKALMANVENPRWKDYSVPITQIARKLCCCYPKGYEKGKMYFMEYQNISKL